MQFSSKHEFPVPFQTPYIVVEHVVADSSYRRNVSISALIFDFRVASNARIIPRKSKEYPSNSDISFSGL